MSDKKRERSFVRQYLALIFCALVLNLIFLWATFKSGEYCFGTLVEHGEVGYNIARYNSCKINPERVQCVADKQQELARYVDYAEIDAERFGAPTEYRDVGDTVGYGCVLGLLWKVTGSYRYRDVQLLQILIFSLLMPLVFQIAFMLFGSGTCALVCSVALLLFFPLVFQNVQAHRDIWAYYGTIILLWCVLKFLRDEIRLYQVVVGGFIFALIQFVRPNLFFGLAGVLGMLVVYALVRRQFIKKSFLLCLIFVATNVCGFWAPFFMFNKRAYGIFFASPVGQDLLHGIGEYENPWGYKLDDGWYHNFMKERCPQLKTRQERDAQAKELFFAALRERPLFFVGMYAKRFIAHLVPNLPWSHYPESLYEGCCSLREKIQLAAKSPFVFLDLLGRMAYIRFFLLLGYAGLALLLWRRNFFACLMLLGVVAGGFSKFASHLEYRYLVPFYWPFAFCAGYLVWFFFFKQKHIRKLFH